MTGHVVITGGANGLGWELAKRYWGAGYHVHIIDYDKVCLEKRHTHLTQRCSIYLADLLDEAQLAKVCEQLLVQNLSLSVLVNNAGITHRSKASSTDIDVFDRVMKLNWRVPVNITRRLMPLLVEARGKIICVASMAGLMPVPGRAAYCASKSALSQHFETWRPELIRKNIGLLMVYPSFIATNIEKNAIGENGGKATHPRSKVGIESSAGDIARRIYLAATKNKPRLLATQWSSRFGLWLWRWTPGLFQRISWFKFRKEIE